MKIQNTHQEHDYIASRVPDIELLANGKTTNHLGSFVLGEITNGDFVPVTSRKAFEADFDKVPIFAGERDLAQEFIEYRKSFINDPDKAKFAEVLEDLPERQRELFVSAVFGVTLAQEFFAEQPIDRKMRDTDGWLPVDISREDTYNIKKLSSTADSGICVEYSLIVGEVMRRLGQEMYYTVGYRQDWSDEPGIYHAFLSTDNARIIVDPLLIAQTIESTQPMGLLQTSGDTLVDNPREPQTYQDVFARDTLYSATPIAAQV